MITTAAKVKSSWNKGVSPSEETRRKISMALKGKKKTPEHIEKVRLANLGKKTNKPAWNRGKKWSEEVLEKLRKANKGKHYSPTTEFKKGSSGFIGKHSNETKSKISEHRKGIRASPSTEFKKGQTSKYLNVNWKGGITSLNMQIRHCSEMKQWRSDVFKRDNWICQTCGKRGETLNAHHKKQFHIIIKEYNIKTIEDALLCSELWDINNGVTLCEECHLLTKIHRRKK